MHPAGPSAPREPPPAPHPAPPPAPRPLVRLTAARGRLYQLDLEKAGEAAFPHGEPEEEVALLSEKIRQLVEEKAGLEALADGDLRVARSLLRGAAAAPLREN